MSGRAARNLYGGKCVKCGEHVPPNGGLREKRDGKWVVMHADDGCVVTDGLAVADVAEKRVVVMRPTDEQQACLDLYRTGASMVIEAGAGTGKTSTLRLLANADPSKRIVYVAYNKAIVKDVEATMPRNVTSKTAHSLAYAQIGKRYRKRLDRGRQSRHDVARRLGIDTPMAFKMEDGSPPKVLAASYLSGYVMQAIDRFCQTADERPAREHFPYVEAIDVTEDGRRSYVNNAELAREMEPMLERAWADIRDDDGYLRYKHDYYLKLWQLSHPRLDVDVVMLDEAQDADPVIAAIVAEQTHAQRVYVGDANQEIYAWRGAVNALSQIDTDNRRLLTQSFRFGQAIADAANDVLAGLSIPTDLRLRGLDSIDSTLGSIDDDDVDAILCRTNARALTELFAAIERGARAFLVGGGKEIAAFARAALDLMAGRGTDHPELSCFDTWGSVQAFVEQDEQGEELRLMVKLVDDFGAREILDALDEMADDRDADVTISTAHKSKGREWSRVRLATDFQPKDPNAEPDDAEIRLRYVAVTRARDRLDASVLGIGVEPDPNNN